MPLKSLSDPYNALQQSNQLPFIVKALFLMTLMSLLLSDGSLSVMGHESQDSLVNGIAMAQSSSAAVLSDVHPDLEDHYGNPAHFMQYIIRIPPVHA